MDTATSDIRAVEFTPSRDGDSPVMLDLLGQILEDEQMGTVTAMAHMAPADATPPIAGKGQSEGAFFHCNPFC